MRASSATGGLSEDFTRYSEDWVQEFFTKLVQNDGRIIASFRGTTDSSAYAFLGSIALSIVTDHMRFNGAVRRRALLTPLNDEEVARASPSDSGAHFSAILDLIDVERTLRNEHDSKNPERDLLIFRLHFLEGLSAREIALIPALKLTTSGLEKVLSRLRNRIIRQNA
jgi:DNA-directed RNA polymerase specialized sigma24 family protein